MWLIVVLLIFASAYAMDSHHPVLGTALLIIGAVLGIAAYRAERRVNQ